MSLNEKYYIIEKMVKLIELKITGNASEFAKQIGISRSQLFIEIEKLKSMDVEIYFDRSIRSFVFNGNKKVVVRKPILVVERNSLTSINGGYSSIKNLSVLFSGRNTHIFATTNQIK
ncbi:MAG: hypothetical protein JW717_14635 [Marinilabiliaceae bacterium]|nr:hypothetical protein [Marinilabiliaceae bacterium]